MSDVPECYDPAFLLPLFTYLLAPGKFFVLFSILVSITILLLTYVPNCRVVTSYAMDVNE